MKILYAIHRYDVSMFFWLNNAYFHTRLVNLCRFISKTGDGELYGLIMLIYLWHQGFNSPVFHSILLGFVVERPVYFILKNSFKRNRPAAALENFRSATIPADQFSFPSGHTSAAFMMAVLLHQFLPDLAIPLYGWALMVGFSRVVLGVHFPTDTLVGAGMGITIGLFCLEQVH